MMSKEEARSLRLSTGKSRKEWAELLDITPKTITTIETSSHQTARPGKMLEKLWRIVAAQYRKST